MDSPTERPSVPQIPLTPILISERVSSIDTLRGIALFGILCSNIDIFAGPETFYELPQGLPDTTFLGAHLHLNLTILFLKWLFIEGRMRALFAMLFGVGLVLMAEHAEKRGAQASFADVYLRRNMWLVVFGVLHGVLIFAGDILLPYALSGLLILYPLRKLTTRSLLIAGLILSFVAAPLLVPRFLGTAGDIELSREAKTLSNKRAAGILLNQEEQHIVKQWTSLQANHAVVLPPFDEGSISMAGFTVAATSQWQAFLSSPLSEWLFLITESVGAMMIGIALYKIGFFTGRLSYWTYIIVAVVGYGLSAPLTFLGLTKVYRSGFDFITAEIWLYRPYEVVRIFGAIANVAVAMCFIKAGIWKSAQRLLAKVGRTALSNYIMTSLLCQTVFVWGPWKLYGALPYWKHHLVMLGIWAINACFSILWLRFFAFGPLEWLWRSLSYWRIQPLIRPASH